MIIHCVFVTEYYARCSTDRPWPTSAVLGTSLGELDRYGKWGNCLVKTCYVEKIVSKVFLIACDHLLVSKMPRKLRKNEENGLSSQNQDSQTILDKSPWDNTAIFIFFCHFSVPSFFEIFLQFLLPHPIQSWNTEKNSGYTRPTLFVGWGEELDLGELENVPEMQKWPKTFVYDCRCNC